MKRYEKQGRENAKNYIREKYGIDAKITEINCEKYSSSPVPDFFPSPTGNVFVKMKYKGTDFLVAISGQKKNTDGLDNYQFQEIATAFAQEMYNITGLHAEIKLFLKKHFPEYARSGAHVIDLDSSPDKPSPPKPSTTPSSSRVTRSRKN